MSDFDLFWTWEKQSKQNSRRTLRRIPLILSTRKSLKPRILFPSRGYLIVWMYGYLKIKIYFSYFVIFFIFFHIFCRMLIFDKKCLHDYKKNGPRSSEIFFRDTPFFLWGYSKHIHMRTQRFFYIYKGKSYRILKNQFCQFPLTFLILRVCLFTN